MFEKYVPQIVEAWRRINPQKRLGYAIIAIMAVAAILGVGYWSSQPDYVVLSKGLTTAESAKVIEALETANIKYRLTFGGSSVLVPKSSYSDARLATSSVTEVVAEGAEDSSSVMGISGLIPDPETQARSRLTDREKKLEKLLKQLKFVESAQVKLAFPRQTTFMRETGNITASVVITPAKGITMTARHATSIAALVSNSVEGLKSDNVAVSDSQGNMFSNEGVFGSHYTSQMEYERGVESSLEANAIHLLDGALGVGHSRVTVNAEFDFTRLVTKETKLDQTNGVEIRREEEKTQELQPDGYIGGSAGNLKSAQGPTASKNSTMNKKDRSTSEIEPGRTETEREELAPKLVRLTVAAVVDNRSADGATELIPAADVQSLLEQSVGFDKARGDVLSLTTTKLVGVLDEAEPGAPPATQFGQIQSLLQSASLGISALAALIIAWIALRKFQPLAMPIPQGASLSGRDLERIRALAAEAEKEPEIVAAIIRTLLAEDNEKEAQAPKKRAA